MRALEPARLSFFKLAGAILLTGGAVVVGFWELERALFGNVLTDAHSHFYSLRGMVMALSILGVSWVHVQRNRTALRKADAVFRELIEASPGAVIGADAGGRINYANPAAHTLFRREDLTGKPLTILMPPEYRAAHLAGWIRFLRYRKSHLAGRESLGLEGERGDGTTFPLALTITDLGSRPPQLFASLRSLEPEIGRIEAAMQDVLRETDG
jgi:PAS domain S-box-containing protein